MLQQLLERKICLIACNTLALAAAVAAPETASQLNMSHQPLVSAELCRRGHEGMDHPPASPAGRPWQRHEGDTGSEQQGTIRFQTIFNLRLLRMIDRLEEPRQGACVTLDILSKMWALEGCHSLLRASGVIMRDVLQHRAYSCKSYALRGV